MLVLRLLYLLLCCKCDEFTTKLHGSGVSDFIFMGFASNSKTRGITLYHILRFHFMQEVLSLKAE